MSDSSDDDMPLARSNGHVSAARISAAEDKAMEPKGKPAPAGLSIRNGPVDEDAMDIDSSHTNGKRKSRSSIVSVSYKDESGSDDDKPLAKRQKTKLPPSYAETALPDSDDDDMPLSVKLAAKKADIEKKAAKDAKAIRAKEKKAKEESSDDDAPLSSSRRKSNGVKRAVKEESDSDVPLTKKKAAATKAKAKATPTKATPAKNGKAKPAEVKKAKGKAAQKEESAEAEDEDDESGWWNAPKKEDESIKWTTLEHNGVLFADEYVPLPKHVKLVYDGKKLNLPVDVEECAWYFGSMFNSKLNVDNPVFQKNFFTDFKEAVAASSGKVTDQDGNKVVFKDFSKFDWQPMCDYADQQVAQRKNRTKEEKKAVKDEKDAREKPFQFCMWDGKKEKVGNFRVEPPSLFRGRGEHPKTGKIKKRVHPNQITINIGKDAPVPKPPYGKWKAVVHDNKATWLASWQENINGAYKYVMLAAGSSVKGQADFAKFEKARELKKHIDKIRKDYTRDLSSTVMADRQRATAMYLIDKFALRAGNEKNAEEEAETVGCCSLKYEHVSLKEPNTVIFDFLGKDSIRFHDEFTVEKQVFKNLKIFKKSPKSEGDDIFDRLTTTQLNKHLKSYMDGLTAKVFRTYNASVTMSNTLQELTINKNSTLQEKVKLYNDCNRQVAILCNHKRTVGAGHEAQMEKLVDRIKGLRYQQWRTKMMMLDVDPKYKKKKGADFFVVDESIDEAWILEHQKFLVEEQRTKITKKFEKDNEKLVAEGKKKLPEKELKERLKVADELAAKFKKENKSKKVEAEGRGPTVEKLDDAVKKIDERIRVLETQAADRDGNKEVALGTSKINYIDPRLTVVFSKKSGVPIEKFFSTTLREKFKWALEMVKDDKWEF
ncbi:DNA topoisomerase [Plectosphaerella plurivora]|uniref:DNA topoisomerase I n=1 Tax=Plectosphaerella plurivora TaxID=936078 RepID=A0A9P9AD25_9PEZI|nr:DNA topoisomerase [Plectosphaerella plurivora]